MLRHVRVVHLIRRRQPISSPSTSSSLLLKFAQSHTQCQSSSAAASNSSLLLQQRCHYLPSQHYHQQQQIRLFSSESFQERLRKMKESLDSRKPQDEGTQEVKQEEQKDSPNGDASTEQQKGSDEPLSTDPAPHESFLNSISSKFASFQYRVTTFVQGASKNPHVSKVVKTILNEETKKEILRKTVKQADSFRKPGQEGESTYEGPTTMVHVPTPKTAWEQISDRFQESEFIRKFVKGSREFQKAAAGTEVGKQAQQMGESVSNKIHDAKEFWETTQNPIIYNVASAWDTLTARSEEHQAIDEIEKLQPDFDIDEWSKAMVVRVELIIKSHLAGDLKTLQPVMGEAIYNKLKADINTRKHDGLVMDDNVLFVDQNQLKIRMMEHEGPIILVTYHVQLINCVKNKAGEIVEGAEDAIVAKFYTMAFKQTYDDETEVVDWKLIDIEISGGTPYL